jgi:mannose-6-phosphate isomerase-like protein (cupin superfamily)
MANAAQATLRHVAAEEGTSFWFLGSRFTLKATSEDTAGAFGLIETVQPAGFIAPPHVHHAEEEVFYILAGEITVFCGDSIQSARPGSLVWLPRDVPHWFRVEGEKPVHLLQWNFPGGLERFFLELGEPIVDPATPPAGPPDIASLLAVAPRYQIEMLVPAHPDAHQAQETQ